MIEQSGARSLIVVLAFADTGGRSGSLGALRPEEQLGIPTAGAY